MKTHIVYWIGILVAAFVLWGAFNRWSEAHDARIAAEIKTSEAAILRLEDKITELDKIARERKTVIIRQVEAVKTPEQAVAAIPTLTLNDLHARTIPGFPDVIAVNAVAATRELGKCAEDRVDLESCKAIVALKEQELTEKDTQIKLLKKKPSFWKRFASGAKKVGIGIAIGLGIAGAYGAAL